MKEKRKTAEEEIRQLLKVTKAESNALKKLISALQEEELRLNAEKCKSNQSTNKNI